MLYIVVFSGFCCSLTLGCILDARVIPIKYYMCPSVTVHLVGGILDEVQHNILDESFAGPLERPEYGTSINNHSVSGTS